MIMKEGRSGAQCDLEAERKVNRKFIEMETRGATDRFAAAVEAIGCEYALTGAERMKVVLNEQMEIKDLYSLAAQSGAQIRRLNFKRDSLEDIFLMAME